MKNKYCFILLLLFVFSFARSANAQWVTIPDANFAAYLQQTFPSCMNGNQMDTTCSAIVTATQVHCDNLGIVNLEGIQYFKTLFILYCDNNQLSSLPLLPVSLINLDCSGNQLTNLPSLPPSLKYLYCGANQLSNLPALPASLEELICWGNIITSLPVLPGSMTYLACSNNQLTMLPALPNTLMKLVCNDNQITTLPTLPSSLREVYCYSNALTGLPLLPWNLEHLDCSYNNIINLPALSNSLLYLDCSHNSLITSLPVLPPSLNHLDCSFNSITSLTVLPSLLFTIVCSDNQLTELPALPVSLTHLDCHNNQISCFPSLPVSLFGLFNIINNPFTCLPNYVPAMDSATLTIPLCIANDAINNPNACSGAKGIVGSIYRDVNTNCSYDAGDAHATNIPVGLYDSNGILLNTYYSLSNGLYNFYTDSGTYKVSVDTTGKPYLANCMVDSTFTLDSLTPLVQQVNFAIGCKPGFDVGVQNIHPRGLIFPGLAHRVLVDAGDLSQWYDLHCANGISGTVEINVTGPVSYDTIVTSMLTPDIINGNSFTFNIADFGALPLHSFGLWFTTDTSASAGDPICIIVDVTPTAGDNDTSNNHSVFCYAVTNSFDPNEKEVSPTGSVCPDYHDYFTYTLHFQNTGTAPAQNIRLIDTLDTNLDISTFEISGYSHANTTTLTGNVLAVRFPNIQLPASTGNPDGSQGWFQYKIKPFANLTFGTQVQNKAYVYFDFNTPIVTNTTVNDFNNTTGIIYVTSVNETISVFPNPFYNKIAFQYKPDVKLNKVSVFNSMGELVLDKNIRQPINELDLSFLQKGVYFISIITDKNNFTTKIVKL